MEMKNSVSTGIELLYRNKSLVNIPFDDDIVKEYNNAAFELDLEELVSKGNWSKDFNIPQYYKDINVKEYITRLIPASGQDVKIITERVDMELAEFEARNLFLVLQLLIFLIDTMINNNLVWV